MASNEWDLLTAIVTANNKGDSDALCAILANENYDFSDKPRCVHAAITAIELVPKNVNKHKEVLSLFVEKISSVQLDMRSGIRLEMLKQMLKE